MAQVLEKPYECHTCKKQIRISKIDGAGPNAKRQWNRFEMDGVTPHKCQQQQQPQAQPQQLPTTAMTEKPLEIMKEIQAIKAHLLGLVSRLDRLEQELQK